MQKKKGKTKDVTLKGQFVGNQEGYGFVVIEGQSEDIFIPPSYTNTALHGDEVLCRVIPKKEPDVRLSKNKSRRNPKAKRLQQPKVVETTKRITGEIIEITNRKSLLGTYFTSGLDGFIRPLENKIPFLFTVSERNRIRFGLADGHRVLFNAKKPRKQREDRPMPTTQHIMPGQVVEVLGHVHDPGVDVLTLVRQFNVPYVFSEEVINQVAAIPEEIKPGELKNRKDLRQEYIITIDGEDTKDIDDAISLEKTADGNFLLGVHISDVSHYVKPDTPMDVEALNRGTSVYLADRVIPMLPHKLSSGVCSLFPGVDRLTLSCIMTVDNQGTVINYEITPSVIQSKRRFTYEEVQEILDTDTNLRKSRRQLSEKSVALSRLSRCVVDDDFRESYEPENQLFANMDNLREILSQKRKKRGALDFDLPEAKIRVDENGKPISVEPYNRNRATAIIEEFMILCNETIASHAIRTELPIIYRTHEPPSQEKLARLQGVAQGFGFHLQGSNINAIQQLLESTKTSPAYYSIAMATLTSLPQAYYTPDSPKHFGLASENYCHFTSPIRRYADLSVHRMLKNETCDIAQNTSLHGVAAQCSRTEREAEALEREVAQLKKVQFMTKDIGKAFVGNISGITPWGLYVALDNTIEGLIPYKLLKAHGYAHNKDKNRYEAKKGRDALSMGQKMHVQLLAADVEERRLIFTLHGVM